MQGQRQGACVVYIASQKLLGWFESGFDREGWGWGSVLCRSSKVTGCPMSPGLIAFETHSLTHTAPQQRATSTTHLPTSTACACSCLSLSSRSTARPAATAALQPPYVLKYSMPPEAKAAARRGEVTRPAMGKPLPVFEGGGRWWGRAGQGRENKQKQVCCSQRQRQLPGGGRSPDQQWGNRCLPGKVLRDKGEGRKARQGKQADTGVVGVVGDGLTDWRPPDAKAATRRGEVTRPVMGTTLPVFVFFWGRGTEKKADAGVLGDGRTACHTMIRYQMFLEE